MLPPPSGDHLSIAGLSVLVGTNLPGSLEVAVIARRAAEGRNLGVTLDKYYLPGITH